MIFYGVCPHKIPISPSITPWIIFDFTVRDFRVSGFGCRMPPAKPGSRLPNPAGERQPTCRLGRLADLVKSPSRPVAKSPRRGRARYAESGRRFIEEGRGSREATKRRNPRDCIARVSLLICEAYLVLLSAQRRKPISTLWEVAFDR